MKNVLRLLIGLVVISSLSSCGYNSMVEKREAVNQAWGGVESSYQRRADLIPNLVSTVKGAANFEQTTLEKVVEARASATQIKLDPNDLTEENLAKFQAAQNTLSQSLGRLLAVSENYPELKATQSFQDLQSQLEGTENRINKSRNDFNAAVQDYNAYIAKFPQVMIAKMFGFTPRAYFKSDPGSEKAPEVKF
ncbi:MAG: LemA family protein [Chitinophagales bacterium]